MRARCLPLCLMLGLSGEPGVVAAPGEPLAVSVHERMEAFSRGHTGCDTVTDGCVICAVKEADFACSTPQIACVQKPLSCTERAGIP